MNDNEPTATPRPHCCYCSRPLRVGEPHWAGDRQGRPWHYGCAEKAGLTSSWFRRGVRRFAEDTAERDRAATDPACWEAAELPG